MIKIDYYDFWNKEVRKYKRKKTLQWFLGVLGSAIVLFVCFFLIPSIHKIGITDLINTKSTDTLDYIKKVTIRISDQLLIMAKEWNWAMTICFAATFGMYFIFSLTRMLIKFVYPERQDRLQEKINARWEAYCVKFETWKRSQRRRRA